MSAQEIIVALVQRYFPGWRCQFVNGTMWVDNGKVMVTEEESAVLSNYGPWYLFDIGYAIARWNNGGKYSMEVMQKEISRIKSLWEMEPV